MRNYIAAILILLLAPMAQAQGYRIQPGDVLEISVLEDSNFNRRVLVRPDGGISLPIAGNIRAGGNTVAAIERVVTERLSSSFSVTPTVSVALAALGAPTEAEPATVDVYFIGEIASTGLIEVRAGSSVLEAIAQAGGLGQFAAEKRIQLRRTDRQGVETIYLFNYAAIEDGVRIKRNLRVQSGDTIVVPERKLFE